MWQLCEGEIRGSKSGKSARKLLEVFRQEVMRPQGEQRSGKRQEEPFMAVMKKSINDEGWRGCGEEGTRLLVCGNVTGATTMQNSMTIP